MYGTLGCVNDYGECVVRTIILLILILYTIHEHSSFGVRGAHHSKINSFLSFLMDVVFLMMVDVSNGCFIIYILNIFSTRRRFFLVLGKVRL